MANTPDQNQDPISLAWNKSRQLRDELAAKAGKPDNLETGVGDSLLGFTGSTLTNTGSTIKNLSLGDASRAMRATADGSYMQGNVDSAVDMVTGGDIQKTREQGKGLLTDALGLGDVQFVGVDPSKNPVKEAVGNVIGKAASAGTAVADSIDQNIVKPVVEPVGKAIQSGGEGLKNLRSDDAKLADQSKFYTQDEDGNYHFGDAWSDPAKFVTRAVDVFGSLAPMILSGLITKGAVAPMVTKSMLKRGLSAEAAAVIGKATADRVAQNVVLAGGIGMSVGQSKDQAREAVSGLSYEELMSSPTFRENVRLVNEDPNNQTLSSTQRLEFARERTAEQAASYAGSDPTTYAGAVAGTVLGDAYLFKMITGKKEAAQVTGNILARTAKGFFKVGVREGTGETIEEGLQKNIANRASNEVGGTNIDPWEGAGLAALEAGTLGVLTGGATGSVSADIHGSSKPAADTTTNTATPPTGPQTTTPSNVAGEVDVNTAIKEVSEGRKVAGSLSIGKGPEGYRAAYINQGGELRVTKPFATAEEAQQAAIQTTQPLRAEAPQQAATQPTPDQAMQQTDDLANIPAFMRNGQELSPELEQASNQAMNNAWQDAQAQQAKTEPGVMQPREKTVTGNPDEPAFLRTQQNNPTGRDTSTLQDADPYTQAQAALAKGGAPTADDLIQQSIQNGNQGKTPQEAGLTGDLLLAKQQPGVPATTEQSSGATVDGQANEVIPESRGLGYSGTINMPGQPGNGINDSYVPPVTQSRQTADKSLDTESTRDPRSPVAQSIAQAGTESDSIFGQLKSLRVTKKGKPFSSVKEAQLASRKTETPIELPTGGYGVVDKGELEQALNKWGNQPRSSFEGGMPGNQSVPFDAPVTQPSNVDVNESASSPVAAQNQPNINVNESSAGQATSKQIADQVKPSPDMSGVPLSLISEFPDFPLTNEGYIPVNNLKEEERSALEAAGIVEDVSNSSGKTYKAVDPEHLWEERKRRQIEARNNGVDKSAADGKWNEGVERRAQAYERLAKEQEDLGDLGDADAIVELRAKAAEARGRVKPSPDTVTPPVVATDSQQTTTPSAGTMVEHKTGKGKVLRGVVRTDLTVDEAKAIDPYTFKKDGGYFIREKHLDKLPAAKESDEAAFESRENKQLASDDVMALEQLKQLRIDTINKINQQEAGNRAVDDRLLRKKDQLDKAIAEAEGTTEKQAAPKEQFADNKLFTADRVAAARARLKSKIGQLNSGLDPEIVMDGMTIAGAYIESGVRNFAAYAKSMTDDFGDSIKPYLLSFWEATRHYPGLDTKGMTSVEDSAKQHAELMRETTTKSPKEERTRQEQQATSKQRPGADLFGANTERADTGASGSSETATGRDRAGSESEVSGEVTGKNTVSHNGITIEITPIRQSMIDDYNRAVHLAGKRDFNEELKTHAKNLIDFLANPKKHLLDSAEQKDEAERQVQWYMDDEVKRIQQQMQAGINNPSWFVTGRSNRDMNKYNKKTDREMDLLNKIERQREAGKLHIVEKLTKLKPQDVKTNEAFSAVSRDLGVAISAISEYMRDGRTVLEKEARKWASPKAGKLIEQSLEIDRDATIGALKKADADLQNVGGLVKVLGSRSAAGKLVNGLLGGETEKVQFSKMPLNAAEKSGKGMTKPEAELAAKEWLKQFKTDVQVKVAKDQAEFDQLMTEAGQGGTLNADEIANAAYLPESKTLLLNASAIQNPARLRKLMRHEILGHHGLEYVIGKGAVNDILQILKNGYATSKAIRDAVDTVAANYADADVKTKIKEAFAHYAENRPVDQGPLGRLWQRIVSMVKSALQKVKFISVNESEQQLDSVLHAIAKNMRKGIEDGVMAERSSDAMFSRSSTADDELMTKLGLGPKPNLAEKTKSQIDALKQTDRNTVKAWIKKVGRQANTQILDALAPIKYAEESAGSFDATNSAYVAARLSSGSASVMQATMLYGLPEWKDGVVQRKNGTTDKDALLGIFSDLGTDLHNWLAWMAGHRAEILMQEGRENLLSAADIAKLKLKGAGKEAKFNEAKKKWNKLNGAVLDMAQESGLIKAEERANWESEWYIPFFRETDDGDVTAPFKKNGIANQSSGIKKLKGGTANVNDLLENIFTTTGKLIDASMKNMAAQKLVHNLADTDLISIIDKPNLMDLKAAFKNQGNKMTVRVDGEDHVIHVSDPDLFKAMTMIDMKVDRDPFRKLAMKAKHLITAGVTASPGFMLRNFLRDAASTWAINEDGFKPMIDSIRGVKKAWKMDDSSINMMFSGASFMGGNVRGNDPTAMATTVRKVLKRKGMSPEQINEYESSLITTGIKAKEVIGHYWEKYEQAGEAVENGSREAVYEAAIKAGKSHAQAAFEAKDLMDFSMLGSSKIMRYMVDVLPFFNARMQGLGKLGRAMAANPKQIAMRGGMIAGASMALLALNWDDDRYNDLPDWDKDLNWHFWLGDQHFRIPKPFEIGLMFGTLPERMVRTMGGKDTAAKFGQVVARNILETFSVNPIPQVVRPLAEYYFNYDMFRGAPIENMSDLNVQPGARYDERTSLMMRELGQITGLSPKKLEHIVTGYTGTIGAYVVGICDAIVRASGDYGAAPAIRADQIPVLKSIYQGSAPAKSSQAITDFYQLLDESNQIYATIRQYNKEGRTDDARELLDENRIKLAGRKAMSHAQKQFTALRNEVTLIQRDRILNSDQKRQRIDKILAQRNNMASKLMQQFGTEL